MRPSRVVPSSGATASQEDMLLKWMNSAFTTSFDNKQNTTLLSRVLLHSGFLAALRDDGKFVIIKEKDLGDFL